jgi:octaheme c-type cytochrome (tetrathionate reductase family)
VAAVKKCPLPAWLAWRSVMISAGLTAGALALAVTVAALQSARGTADGYQKRVRAHFDHSPIFTAKFATPQAVTRACLQCHPQAASEVMKTAHWLWLGQAVVVPGRDKPIRIGKKNLINNFCISATGNETSCTKCHIGYGWADDSFDFTKAENVDCLVCHEHTGAYLKGTYGMPEAGVDLLATARSVGTPGRDNCLGCHAYGGGGQGVKHGDLDLSLAFPSGQDDVHMGQQGFACVDCHTAPHHALRGRAFSVSVEDTGGVSCEECHTHPEHADARINAHLSAVACQTCHIPTYARKLPTKATWDWSKAGDPQRLEDPHHYLKIKGEFVYEQDAQPEYHWFNRTMARYLLGDRIDPNGVTAINTPLGSMTDKQARIWPFKVHRAMQPYDSKNQILLTPVTGGKDGYWTNFNWDNAFRLGAVATRSEYSGSYGFARTEMYWPLSHMVAPKSAALSCTDCHGAQSRFDWTALGYRGDPIENGGRP